MKYYNVRKTTELEVPWVRIEDFEHMKLFRPVVLVNGAFDVLHSGHMKIIHTARKRGPTLVCALDGDEKVRKAKGAGRPIQTWIERATTLGYMPLDYIVEIGSDEDMDRLMRVLKPDLRVQGADYRGKPTRYPDVKKCFVYGVGMRTSKIVERILAGERNS